jgi:hypothetical protein
VDTASFGSPAGFGGQAPRMSNAVTSGSFGDQTFSKPLDGTTTPAPIPRAACSSSRRPAKQQSNNLFANEVNLCNFGRGGGKTAPTT